MKYCPHCAGVLEARDIDGLQRRACVSPGCRFVHWDNPVPVVAALVQYQGKIVLARNVQWPDGTFSLITGYLERNEAPETAVVREVKEELGLDSTVTGSIGNYSLNEKNQVILAYSLIASGDLKIGGEIVEVRHLSREELRRWQFGRLTLTAEIVERWLESTAAGQCALLVDGQRIG